MPSCSQSETDDWYSSSLLLWLRHLPALDRLTIRGLTFWDEGASFAPNLKHLTLAIKQNIYGWLLDEDDDDEDNLLLGMSKWLNVCLTGRSLETLELSLLPFGKRDFHSLNFNQLTHISFTQVPEGLDLLPTLLLLKNCCSLSLSRLLRGTRHLEIDTWATLADSMSGTPSSSHNRPAQAPFAKRLQAKKASSLLS